MIQLKFSRAIRIFPFTILMLILFVAITIIGCNSSSKKQVPPQSQSSNSDNEKVPDELKEIESKIDHIVIVLNGPIAYKDNEQKDKNTEEDNSKTGNQNKDEDAGSKESSNAGTKSNEGNQQNKGNQGENQANGQQNNGNQTNVTQKEQPKNQSILKNDGTNVKTNSVDEKAWQDALDDLKSVHSKWNAYMPKAVSVHIGTNAIESFSDALNNVTNIFREKDRIKTLIAVNKVYYYITDFYKNYKNKKSPELKKIKYYTRDIILESINNNWNKTDSEFSNLQYSWNVAKTTVSKEEDEKSDKLDMAILEFSKVIKEKNSELINIKGALLLKNLQDFEDDKEQ